MKRAKKARVVMPGGHGCICEWPEDCGGTRVLHCEGCGGDGCVCKCSSLTEAVMECPGCDDCDSVSQESWGDGFDDADGDA